MSGRMVAIAVAVAATAAVVVLALGGGGSDEDGTTASSGAGPENGAAGGERSARVRGGGDREASVSPQPRPERPRLRTTAPLDRGFEAEPRDAAWAEETERGVADRLDALLPEYEGVDVPRAECRRESCRVIVTGTDERAFQGFVEALQGERGFYGFADLIALGKPEARDDGVEMSVILHFERFR